MGAGLIAVKLCGSNIKEVIDIDWDRELEEGSGGAVGLDPTIRSQQEMNIQHYINAFRARLEYGSRFI
ncbi:hypothetical protein J4727_08925 [Providencia rettgeri]|uniref:Uncharacterized protein n=1 Tax=Providencia rettgeri TaxID=587 RepID=A0A939NB83_PRORE|nr:hypothetical protein [Providencia rettgeri]